MTDLPPWCSWNQDYRRTDKNRTEPASRWKQLSSHASTSVDHEIAGEWCRSQGHSRRMLAVESITLVVSASNVKSVHWSESWCTSFASLLSTINWIRSVVDQAVMEGRISPEMTLRRAVSVTLVHHGEWVSMELTGRRGGFTGRSEIWSPAPQYWCSLFCMQRWMVILTPFIVMRNLDGEFNAFKEHIFGWNYYYGDILKSPWNQNGSFLSICVSL